VTIDGEAAIGKKSSMPSRRIRAFCLAAVMVGSLACDEQKHDAPAVGPATSAAPTVGPLATMTATASASAPAPTPSATAPTVPDRVAGAALILVSWKGAELAPAGVTRSKADAKKRADEALDKLKHDTSFEDVVKNYSDDPGTKRTGGALGNIERGVMPDAFSDALFAMTPGEVSGVVETPRGFYVIKRTR
jgi:hypothetical protein